MCADHKKLKFEHLKNRFRPKLAILQPVHIKMKLKPLFWDFYVPKPHMSKILNFYICSQGEGRATVYPYTPISELFYSFLD